MIVASRDTKQIQKLKNSMDAEVEIQGFDGINIERYAKKLLGTEAETFLEQTKRRSIYDWWELSYGKSLLSIPILLHMLCTLFHYNKTLPDTRAGIIEGLVNRCINRESIRKTGEKALLNAKLILLKLGKMAWEGLMTPGKKLIFEKVLKSCIFTKL